MDKNEISDYKEFNSVIEQLNQLIEKQSNHIKQLIHIGESLSAKNSLVNIFNLILSEAMHYCNADGGTIYVVSSDGQYLDFKLMFNVSLNQKMGDVDSPITWLSVPLFNIDESPNMNHMVSYVYHTKESKAFDDVYEQNLFDNTGTKKYDKRNNYRSKSMVAIPLINHEDEVMGVIQLINAQDEENKTIGFNEDHLLMLNSLASQAAISLSNSRLIENLEELLLQFIKSIATAIDRKSKYTAGHVKRVATLTEKMARAVNNDEDGAFENVYFSSDQLKEISMSGWMHDVGKIVIPECIMDKSTKLEKIIDRIELIRIRSDLLKEVIRKDILTFERDGILTLEKRNKLENIIAQIEKDYRLIEKLNIGSESLPDNLKNEIQRIQDFSYFSNGREYKIITDDEAKNLKIYRGTLTDEEFLVMKDHAQVTWDMLSPLQFPKKYENVPLYASSHHERLNGKGYPNKYPEQKIPLQARIIAVADVFEALLSDRPYKAGKKLSDALKIIAYMVKDHELDSRIVDLLLDSGLYLSFARDIVKVKKDLIDSFEIEEIKKIYRE